MSRTANCLRSVAGSWSARLGLVLLFAATGTVGWSGEKLPLHQPSIAIELPVEHNTPDGMTLDSDGNILLACPNFNTNLKGNEQPAWIMKITPNDKLEPWFPVPVHPQTGKACPLGIAFGSDGNLYVADCQALGGNNNRMSRLLRIVVTDKKPVRCESVAEGFVMSNGVACFGDAVYVTETSFEPKPAPGPMPSGVVRLAISEMSGGQPIRLQPGGKDPHVVARLVTKSEAWKVGANGIGFAPDGTMYVCNFGDAQLIAVKLDRQGRAVSQRVVAEGPPIKSTDGMKVDPRTGLVYIADFLGNAVHCVNPQTGQVTVIAQNGPTNGHDGELDKPSEVCLRGPRLYVSNIDLDKLDGNTFDKPYTVSVIDLSK
ncbi:MAG: SMP-30/gluconolactonase/LRE family protein [Planctomycetota bacterium]|nr:SMP-30/gluconolactonase/LRE family protein [Planctomycetota bacterium]